MTKPRATIRKPALSSPDDLLAYSGEHLYYEITMLLLALAIGRVTISASEDALLQFVKNARVEMFANHLRNIITFLYPEHYLPQQDDVVATDFFASGQSAQVWQEGRGTLPLLVKEAKQRADKEMAHLTTKRIAGTPEHKGWNFEELGGAIVPLLQDFARAADPKRLNPDIVALLESA